MGGRLGQALAAFRIGQPCCGSPSLLRSVVSLGLLGQMPTLWLLEDQKLSPHSLGSRPALQNRLGLSCLFRLLGLYWETVYLGSQPDSSNLSLVSLGKLDTYLLVRMLVSLD